MATEDMVMLLEVAVKEPEMMMEIGLETFAADMPGNSNADPNGNAYAYAYGFYGEVGHSRTIEEAKKVPQMKEIALRLLDKGYQPKHLMVLKSLRVASSLETLSVSKLKR